MQVLATAFLHLSSWIIRLSLLIVLNVSSSELQVNVNVKCFRNALCLTIVGICNLVCRYVTYGPALPVYTAGL